MDILLLGIGLGVVAGLIPGVGVFTTLLFLYPILYDFSISDLFIFYIALVSTTQYMGSVSATILAIPGESSSLPAVYEGHAMFRKGKGALAISGAALGSLLGALVVLALVYLSSPLFSYVAYFFNSFVQSIVLFLILLLLIVSSKSKLVVAIPLCIFAWWLSSIGCSQFDCYVPVDYVDLYTGVPLLSVICGIYVFPQLLVTIKNPSDQNFIQKPVSLINHISHFIKNIHSALRGTIIGFFLGFTPGSSMTVSSNTAYRVELTAQRRKGTYEQGNYNSLVAAETANNSATLSNLLPLFLLGIPLSGSEVIFYDLISSKGFVFFRDFTYEFFSEVIVKNLLIINFIAFCIAWPFARYIKIFAQVPYNLMRVFIFFLICFILFYVGSQFYQSFYYLLTFLLLLPIGYLLRNQDTLPFIFIFILQDRFYSLGNTLLDHSYSLF
jgi:putative tricarboxylic transport membrane protein